MSFTNDALADAQWRTSTRSSATNCVEVAATPHGVGVRDSKDRGGPVLLFSPQAWQDFVRGVQSDKFSGGTRAA